MLLDISGFRLSASIVLAAASTASTIDDYAFIRLIFAGSDVVLGSDFGDVLDGFAGHDVINGYAGADLLYGEFGNDRLNGGSGADLMSGGVGNDIYYVDNAGDRVFEGAGLGLDTVYAASSYTLAAGQYVEALAAVASTAFVAMNLAGNGFGQRVTGNNGANVLNGAAGNDLVSGLGGNDVVIGGIGNDTLAGGAGNDAFVFNSAVVPGNVDRIADFNVAQDTLWLDNAVMPGLGGRLGTLAPTMFWKSTTGQAHDPSDRVVYETDTGKLFYASNGSVAGGAFQIAQLTPNLGLTNLDLLVV